MFENAESPYVPGVDYPLTDADIMPILHDLELAAALGDDREALFLRQILSYIREAREERKKPAHRGRTHLGRNLNR